MEYDSLHFDPWARSQARRLVGQAVARGLLWKSTYCTECGADDRPLHGHHVDYLQPLFVIWLCPACHGLRHRGVPS